MSFGKTFGIFLLGLAAILNLYIYTYPSLDSKKCSWAFTNPKIHDDNSFKSKFSEIPYLGDLLFKEDEIDNNKIKDIRLLALGDPQISGNWPSTPYIKRLDNYGNDYYLGHIYQVMKKRLTPTHVGVLGDLFSSQWIGDSEFFNRTRRYVTRLFDQPDRQREYVLDFINNNEEVNWRAFLEKTKPLPLSEHYYDYSNVYDWNTPNYTKIPGDTEPLFLNVSGNHDIGYSGDATWQHMTRFYQLFGKDNYWIEYDVGTPHAWRFVVLNSLLLEGPALQPEFLEYTWEFLYRLFERKFEGATILLTHVPFYKEEGLCVDGPYHDYYGPDAKEHYKVGKLRSQNHLSKDVTQRVLSLIFDKNPGIILTGHDHEGCETYYNRNYTNNQWYASKKIEEDVNIREITVRAMMGDYGGNTGLLTAHFNHGVSKWQFQFSLCPFIVQHVWWTTKVVTIISLIWLPAVLLLGF